MDTLNTFTSFNLINNKNIPILGTEYIIEENDNLYDIAYRYNTTVSILKSINKLKSDRLYPGQIIIVDDLYTEGKEIYEIYVVKENDNIYEIANTHNMTVDELKKLNFLLDEKIHDGQRLIVNKVNNTSKNIIKYKVKPGDSLYKISKKYNTSIEEIKKINNLKTDLLQIGQELNVLDLETLNNTYTVLPGDNLHSIALKKGVSTEALKDMNNLETDKLQVGQILNVPDE